MFEFFWQEGNFTLLLMAVFFQKYACLPYLRIYVATALQH